MYYDIQNEILVSDKEMIRRGLPIDNAGELHRFGFYSITIEQPEYDSATQGIEPDGKPMPTTEDPLVFVQHMRVFNILDRLRDGKKAEATQKRWEHEVSGVIMPDGTSIRTGIDDQNRISTALQGMRDTDMTEVDFKASDGWVKLNIEQLSGIAALIAKHVQECFSNERKLHEAIDACKTLDELNAINLQEGWPVYTKPEKAEPAAPAE